MTAPGDLMLIFGLLAAFVACCGYAAGRVHQRRQQNADRAEAYRDGYATGSRSVFSMAVRAAGRRKERASARAAVPIEPGPAEPVPAEPVPAEPVPAEPVSIGPRAADEPLSPSGMASAVPKEEGKAEAFPVPRSVDLPGLPEPAAPGGVTYTSLPDPQWAAEEPVPAARVGKHTVPDELVRAATYRLPPDRVARAKVMRPQDNSAFKQETKNETGTGPAADEEATRPQVPKPRGS